MKVKYEAMIKLEITEEIEGQDDLIEHPKKTFDEAITEAIEDEFEGRVKVDVFSKLNIEK